MFMDHKAALSALSVGLMAAAYGIYLYRTVQKRGVQPHPFSWLLWGLVTAVGYFVQRVQGGWAGSLVTGLTALVCISIGLLTLVLFTWEFAWFDWCSLGLGLLVFGGYLVLALNPTLSAVLATITDVLGYIPTVKKGWTEPHKDSAASFALNSAKFIPALCVLEAYSISTCLYPATLVVMNGGVALMLFIRQRQVPDISQ